MPKNNNLKQVLIFHGFPEFISEEHPIYKYFNKRNYNIFEPYLFSLKFKLNKDEVEKYVKVHLNKEPDVIVGVSIGGLLAPYLAKRYSKAKLILVATGPYIQTNTKGLSKLINLKNDKITKFIFRMIKVTPLRLYRIFYKKVNRFYGNSNEKLLYENHIRQNWECIKRIPLQKYKEAQDLALKTDNTELLKKLPNKTIIFGSRVDKMIPLKLINKLNQLIKGSKLVVKKDNLHYQVFNENDWKILDKFLK